jgi:hypothetical protein
MAPPTMIAACPTTVPLARVPAHVQVWRDHRQLTGAPIAVQAGDFIRVGRRGRLTLRYHGNTVVVGPGTMRLECRRVLLGRPTGPRTRTLTVVLDSGRVAVTSGPHPWRAPVLSSEMLAYATVPDTHFTVAKVGAHATHAWTADRVIVAASASDQSLRIDTRVTYTAIADPAGLRLDIWPFALSRLQRLTTAADRLVPFWADGLACSVGCTAPGTPGWPLKPFHAQHAIRAGINELRPANFHVAVDIEANNFQPVYAIESGYASIRYPGTGDVNVDVGRFFYWHINPTVANGQYVTAYKTVIGNVLYGFYHVALSEGSTSDYLNPLRPGGSLRPYSDTEPPIIGVPHVYADGRVIVSAFDPQSVVMRSHYETPVLAPSSLAWRLYDARGHALSGLEWAMRGSQNYPPGLRPVIFAPGAANPGFHCFFTQVRCIPNWSYWLAGGLTPALPLSRLRRGRYRLSVYAWDWAGNTSALDYPIRIPFVAAAHAPPESGPLSPRFDYP